MWGKPESPKRSTSTFQASSGETTYIAADAEFNGKLTLKGDARIDGSIEGQITLVGDLIVGPNARINANIKANSISVSGEIRGDIIAQECLELCSTAKMRGNIFSKQLKIDQGAQFIGTSRLLDGVGQESKGVEEGAAPSNAGQDSDTTDMDDILSPLTPLEEDAVDSSPDTHATVRNVAYGKSKARRR